MDISKVNHSDRVRTPSENRIGKNLGFKEIFETKIAGTAALESPDSYHDRTGALEQAHKVLNFLDEFAKDLKNPSKTLKDMKVLADRIQEDLNSMEARSHETMGDGSLDRIFREVAITANVALIKYHRGDYV